MTLLTGALSLIANWTISSGIGTKLEINVVLEWRRSAEVTSHWFVYVGTRLYVSPRDYDDVNTYLRTA